PEWQSHLNNRYGKRNRENGIDRAVAKLYEVATELSEGELRIQSTTKTRSEIEKDYSLELADTLAWTFACANILDISVEKAVVDRYGKGCSTCEQRSCQCGNPHQRKLAEQGETN